MMYHVDEMFIYNLRFPDGVCTKYSYMYEKPYYSFQKFEIRLQKIVCWTVVTTELSKGNNNKKNNNNNNWSHWNSNEKLKEKFGSCTGKTLDRFTTKDRYTWNITHNTESTAV